MQELEKILEEVNRLIEKHKNNAYELVEKEPLTQCYTETDIEQTKVHELAVVRDIIRKHMTDGWILAEDQLPQIDDSSEYYDSVEVTMRNGTVTHGCFRNDEGSWWIVTIDGSYRRALCDEIIAWRPLPNPYRPERSDNHDGE